MKPVCLVIGAGAGIGGNVADKFAAEGYHSYLCRRTDQKGLDTLIDNIEKKVKEGFEEVKEKISRVDYEKAKSTAKKNPKISSIF